MAAVMSRRTLFVSAGLVVAFGMATFLFLSTPRSLEASIALCQEKSTKEERFSCFRRALEEYWKNEPVEEYVHDVEKLPLVFKNAGEAAYAIFGTNCHTFYHALGDFAAAHSEGMSLKDLFDAGSADCTAGYMMGLHKRMALMHNYSDDIMRSLYETCSARKPKIVHSCAHEIGHTLHDKHFMPILSLLDPMTEGRRLALPAEFAPSSIDLRAPFEDCRRLLPETEWPYCYTGVGHNMFLFGEFNPQGFMGEMRSCDSIDESGDKENCYAYIIYRIGINYGGPLLVQSKVVEGIKVCEDIVAVPPPGKEDYREHCYLGVGGGIGLYLDSEYLSQEPSSEQDVLGLKQALMSYARLCENVPTGYVETCFRGLFGTNFKNAYEKYRLSHPILDKIFPDVKDYRVVG